MIGLADLLADHQTGHSEFQDDYLITRRAGGTLYGQYKQALRELYKRFRGLRELVFRRKRLLVEIDELREFVRLNGEGFSHKAQMKQIDLDEKRLFLEEADRAISDTRREFKRFYQQAAWFKGQIGELTDEKRRQLDEEMWLYRIKEMAAIDFVTVGRIRENTYTFLHNAPREMQQRAMELIGDRERGHSQLLSWYESKEDCPELPEILPEIELPEADEMLQIEVLP